MKYFTSDLHFGHDNIIKYCNRPADCIDDMNSMLISNWNSVVKKSDEVFVIGDLSLQDKWMEFVTPKLNGIKNLIIGNHDTCFEKHKKFTPAKELFYKDKGWALFNNILNFKIGNYLVNLNHFPYDDQRYPDYCLEDLGVPLLHGHTHSPNIFSKSKKNTIQIHVGVDAWNYKPVSEVEIIEVLDDAMLSSEQDQ